MLIWLVLLGSDLVYGNGQAGPCMACHMVWGACHVGVITTPKLQQETRAVGGSFSIECYASSWSIRRDGVKK